MKRIFAAILLGCIFCGCNVREPIPEYFPSNTYLAHTHKNDKNYVFPFFFYSDDGKEVYNPLFGWHETGYYVTPFFRPDSHTFYSPLFGWNEEWWYAGPTVWSSDPTGGLDRFRFLPLLHLRFPDREKHPNATVFDGEFWPLFRYYSPTKGRSRDLEILPILSLYSDIPERNVKSYAGYTASENYDAGELQAIVCYDTHDGYGYKPYGHYETHSTQRDFLHLLWRSESKIHTTRADSSPVVAKERYDYIFPFFYRSYEKGEKYVNIYRAHHDKNTPETLDKTYFTAFPFYWHIRDKECTCQFGPLALWYSHTHDCEGGEQNYRLLWFFGGERNRGTTRISFMGDFLSASFGKTPAFHTLWINWLDLPKKKKTSTAVKKNEPDTVINHSIPFLTIEKETVTDRQDYIGTIRQWEYSGLYPLFAYWNHTVESHIKSDTEITPYQEKKLFRFLPFFARTASVDTECGYVETRNFGPLALWYNRWTQSDGALSTACNFLWFVFRHKTDAEKRSASFLGPLLTYDKNKFGSSLEFLWIPIYRNMKTEPQIISSSCILRSITESKFGLSFLYGNSRTETHQHFSDPRRDISATAVKHEDWSHVGLLFNWERKTGEHVYSSSEGEPIRNKVDYKADRYLPFYVRVENHSEGAAFNGVEHYGPLGLWYHAYETKYDRNAFRILYALTIDDNPEFNRTSFLGNFFTIRTGTKPEFRFLFIPFYKGE